MTGSTSISEGALCSVFPSGEDFGVILVTEISDEVMDDDEELSDELTGDLGPWGSIRDALPPSLDELECKYERGERSRRMLITSLLQEDEMGWDFGSEGEVSPFLLLKMLSYFFSPSALRKCSSSKGSALESII